MENVLENYDPAEVTFEHPPEFHEGFRTAVVREGTHPRVEDASVIRHFGTNVIEPTILKDDEELLNPNVPDRDVVDDWEARLEADGYKAVLIGFHDGHTYRIKLEAREDLVIGPDGEEGRVQL